MRWQISHPELDFGISPAVKGWQPRIHFFGSGSVALKRTSENSVSAIPY
jgi:hypothetical protein